MPFVVAVETSRNGKAVVMRLSGVPDWLRDQVEDNIRGFDEGDMPLEGRLRFRANDGSLSALRWADVKKIWIEER